VGESPIAPYTPQLSPASAEAEVPYFLYEFIKSYLHAIYVQKIWPADIAVARLMARPDERSPKPKHVSVTDELETGHYRVADAHIDASVRYKGRLYDVAMYRERPTIFTTNIVSILGIEPDSREPHGLMDTLLRESVRNSPFNNSSLEVCNNTSEHSDSDMYLRHLEIGEDRLDQVFLPDKLLTQISLFIKVLSTYSTCRTSLRYLFSGKPGTAKTKLIRAIANVCRGKATFIFTNGSETQIDRLFDFVRFFSPVVLCIDDIDLMTGSREDHQQRTALAMLLQKLDGFAHDDFFLLATTNDKRLVDVAASRPGRFDMVIDVSQINPAQYADLVRSKTNKEEIVALFDDEILHTLERRGVTGAFIANLVKHLELIHEFDPEQLTKEYVLTFLRESHIGFYEKPGQIHGAVGFRG
jgi:cell division protease FtsH